ncbi:unnamed protein product, partial [Rotaria sp. Silwood1]
MVYIKDRQDSSNYGYRYVGVTTSSTPNGKFTFLNAFQPD